MNIAGTFNYIGDYPEVTRFVDQGIFEVGDIVRCGMHIYVYDGSSFHILSTDANDKEDTTSSESLSQPVEAKCKCCGAPLPQLSAHRTNSIKCEYCGSVYYL